MSTILEGQRYEGGRRSLRIRMALSIVVLLLSLEFELVVGRRSLAGMESGRDLDQPEWMKYPLFHSPKVFAADYKLMKENLKVFIYPYAANQTIYMFRPSDDDEPAPGGNYASEFYFARNLYESRFVTQDPDSAHLFVLPYSVFNLRKKIGPSAVSTFVRDYVTQTVQQNWPYWNRTGGADHLYATCHDIGSHAAELTPDVIHNAIQVICPANVWHRTYIPHKDLGYPQIWPHPTSSPGGLPAKERSILGFWSGSQNSRLRAYFKKVWEDDDEILLGGGRVLKSAIRGTDYFENFRKSKYCMHVTGYQIHTARIGDAIMFGCVPVIISDQYDLPFKDVLDWTQFSVIVAESDIPNLKTILKATDYERLYNNVQTVRRFFTWHSPPQEYDLFNMIMYEIWLRRFVVRPELD